MAQVALFLYLVFIIIALKNDSKECSKSSFALWIPFVWLAISASRSVTAWIYLSRPLEEVSELNYLEGSPIDRAVLLIMIVAGVMVLYKRKNRISFFGINNICLILFYLYAFLSIGWSDYEGTSIRRWIRMAGDLIMVLIVLTEEDQQEAIERVLRRCAILLIPLSVVLIRYYGDIGISYAADGTRMWTGVANQKNTLGMLCAFIGVYLFWRLIDKWPKYYYLDEFYYLDGFLLLLVLYLLRGSRSSTSLVVFIFGLMILVSAALLKANSRKFKKLMIISVLFLLALQVYLTSFFDTSIESLFFTATERDSSFTERMPMWLKLLEIGSQRLIFGAGYGGVWITDPGLQWEVFLGPISNAHNGYIHVFMDMGMVGMMFMILFITQAYKNIMNSFGEKWGIGKLQFVFFVMILFHNVTESSFARGSNFLWFIFLVSSTVVLKKDDASSAINHPMPADIP